MRLRVVAALSAAFALAAALYVFGPLLFQRLQPSPLPYPKGPTLQSMMESGELKALDSPKSIAFLLPYDSISLERTPCFGSCPVYLVTFYRDGHATLETNHLFPKDRDTYSGEIGLEDFARLTQLASLAQTAAKQKEYRGQWTDDYTAIIRVTAGNKTWEVSDYGQVAPSEVWALESIAHMLKEQVEWTHATSGG
jgi:hypothetical protein